MALLPLNCLNIKSKDSALAQYTVRNCRLPDTQHFRKKDVNYIFQSGVSGASVTWSAGHRETDLENDTGILKNIYIDI